MNGVIILKKHFNQVLAPGVECNNAVAIDNMRRAWHNDVRDQVMVIPDYDENDAGGGAVLMVIMAQLWTVYAAFNANVSLTVGDILADYYENREKNRIGKFAHSVHFENPNDPQVQEVENELADFIS